MTAAEILADVPFEHALVLTGPDGVVAEYGDVDRVFEFASVTKLFSALAGLVAVERGMLDLDAPADTPAPEGSTVRHIFAHTSGLPFDEGGPIGRVEAKRVYSNQGFEVLGRMVEDATGTDFADWMERTVLDPLGLSTVVLDGSPAHGASGSAADVAALGRELLRPTLLDAELFEAATTVQYPGLAGILPGYGRQKNNDWGLGFEVKTDKAPHWTGTTNSPATFGHFGMWGGFLWVDREKDLAATFLGTERFGDVHKELWPGLNDALLKEPTR